MSKEIELHEHAREDIRIDLLCEDVIALTEHLRLKEEECKQFQQDKSEFLSTLTEISNMCIGEIAMGYKLDAQYIGELIFKVTGLTNPQLNELEKHK